jgi:glucose-6-phosphate 1-dehydrogenase
MSILDQKPALQSVMTRPTLGAADIPAAGASKAPAATLVIFGAHGDLTKRLLMPALYDLAADHLLDDGFQVIGVDRVASDDAQWRDELTSTMQEFTHDKTAEFYVEHVDEAVWGWVTQRLTYVQADFTKPEDIKRLGGHVKGNAVFYLAIAARFFGEVVDRLGEAGLLKESDGAFRRVVIEKPFGEDLESAKKLNARVLAQAEERQIFRIDHFLGKETVQNIMALRFANGIFEPLWRRDHIDYVEITAAETIGVEERGAFYEPTGALRDMVPNHLFQLLSMVAMEPPNSFDAEAVRSEKAKLLQAVAPVRPEDVVRGQYTAGNVQGHDVPAYRDEHNVAKDSRTETYIALRLHIDNWRWGGVKFYLRTGKHLKGRQTEVVVHFRKPPYALFKDTEVDVMTPNVLTLDVQPHEGMTLTLSAKHPGPKMALAPVQLRFQYKDAFKMAPNVGYETLIYDCLIGDSTLFQRADMIEASWAVVDPAIQHAKLASDVPEMYAAGSSGPAGADALLARDGHSWKELTGE